jgi:hypothetical protein
MLNALFFDKNPIVYGSENLVPRRVFSAVFVLFFALFFTFEQLHPAADLMRYQAEHGSAAAESRFSESTDNELTFATVDAHGPFLIVLPPAGALPGGCVLRTVSPVCRPEEPAVSPPSPIPIPLRV